MRKNNLPKKSKNGNGKSPDKKSDETRCFSRSPEVSPEEGFPDMKRYEDVWTLTREVGDHSTE
jgi:hypothetical protein